MVGRQGSIKPSGRRAGGVERQSMPLHSGRTARERIDNHGRDARRRDSTCPVGNSSADEVRFWAQSGQHLLTASLSAFDPRRTYPSAQRPRGFSICACHLVSGQAGTVDRVLHQSRGHGLFDKFADVGEVRGVTLRDRDAKEVGTVVLVQHPRTVKLC